jgi:uncharacterized coiled-coil protein SlyX
MATKFFSDGAVHAYFNPYETPYDAFMNYMNVLSDFEIRLRKYFPDTAEQDQIFKLGSQVIEKDMMIEKQAAEIVKLTRKVSRIKPAGKISITKPKAIVKKETAIPKPAKKVSAITASEVPVNPAKKVLVKSAKKAPVKPVKKVSVKPVKKAPVKTAKTVPEKPAPGVADKEEKTVKRRKKTE